MNKNKLLGTIPSQNHMVTWSRSEYLPWGAKEEKAETEDKLQTLPRIAGFLP